MVETSGLHQVGKMSVKKKNLDLYLDEVFKQFIAIKDEHYKKSQQVFKGVFDQVKAKMGEKCNYFGKYSSQVMYAGSVYDGIKVSKLDEFDMDIVIRLPINYDNEIIIENDQAGFVKLKIEAFDHLDKQQDWEKIHKVTREWRDVDKYFLQNKFRQWMHGIVQKALNELNGQVTVNDLTYLVKYKETGPAYTLNIENDVGNEKFKLDVDLVPVIRFLAPRWPEGYRTVEDSKVKEWLVVPKPNKAIPDGNMKSRCWRLSFQEFEREMMKGGQQLKTTIRLVKKLRDALQLKDVASYYIKTLFLWKIDAVQDKKYWQKSLGTLFRTMVEEFHQAIKDKNIPYFWHKENNLIENMKPTIQKLYADKLKAVLDAIESNDVDKVVASLLTVDEMTEFKNSDFYQKQQVSTTLVTIPLLRQESNASILSVYSNPETPKSKDSTDSNISNSQDFSLLGLVRSLNDKVSLIYNRIDKIEANSKGAVTRLNTVVDMLKEISNKVDNQSEQLKQLDELKDENKLLSEKVEMLVDKIDSQNERMKKLETGSNKNEFCNIVSTLAEAVEFDHNQIRLN